MLTNKDYCDYDTCIALKELGIGWENVPEKWAKRYFFIRIMLYDAQKWLREEKKIIIEATFSLMYKGQLRFGWRVLYNLTQHKGAYYTFDSVKSKEDYDSYEQALLAGIKKAVKILKDGIGE